MRTRTGRVAVLLGATAVTAKTLALASGETERPVGLALSAVSAGAAVLALTGTVPLARDTDIDKRLRQPWLLLSCTMSVSILASLFRGVIGLFGKSHDPLAHHVDATLGLVGLGLAVAGVLVFPGEKLPRNRWVPAALDFVTLLLAGFLGFWVYALHPAFADADAGWTVRTIITSYTGLSLLLLGGALHIVFRRPSSLPQSSVVSLVAGSILLVAAAAVPACVLVNNGSELAGPMHLGWTLFALCVAVAARSIRTDSAPVPASDRPTLLVAMPFASTGLVGFLLLSSLVSPDLWGENLAILLPATFTTLVLIVVRQTLIARENIGLAVEMRKAKEVAETANSARLQFLANISHDLRTPLNGVLGCAQILLRELTLTAKQKELVRTMQGCAEHLRNLINDLLDLSKLEADRLELAPSAFDLRAYLDRLVRTFGLETESKKLVLELDYPAELPGWIVCDRKRLQQILGNLVHNAIKFTERGRVSLRVRTHDETLAFEVHDTGCGILPDKLGELFQPFHVVDERSIRLEGTGLGLAICKKLARKMGGDIAVQSVIGKGSVFTVTIPLEKSAPVVEVQRTIVDYQGRRRRILIVDDQPANRVVLRTMLEPLDFLVDEAADAPHALEHIRFARPDVILMDLMMPGIDGFDLCRQVSALDITPRPACLAISAMSGEEVEARCRDVGFRELLNKPVNLELLLEALHTHAAIEWTYGVIQPAPTPPGTPKPVAENPEIVPPPPEEIAALLDLARRGFVRNIETHAAQLAQKNPKLAAFAGRVTRYVSDFKMKELTEWLASLAQEHVHEST